MIKAGCDLERVAVSVMREKGLEPSFSKEAEDQLKGIKQPAPVPEGCVDLREMLWCSIDNDDSRDLDQLTYAEEGADGKVSIWVAIADVDALVAKNTPIDLHAQTNTTSVYTPAVVFPMLPQKLSTDLTSLNENEDRLTLVVKAQISQEGQVESGSIFQAIVRNRAQLAYSSTGAWLGGQGPLPDKIKGAPGLEKALKTQSDVGQLLKKNRHILGALTLDLQETQAKVIEGEVTLQRLTRNYADELIESFMIAANVVMANHLKDSQLASLRRVVRVPKNWPRMREVARALGVNLPEEPDSVALENFMVAQKEKDPKSFPDLSLTMVKLLGRGEYVVESPGDSPTGHFALALTQYTHSTAPNRRFPDLITQRQCKASLNASINKDNNPYSVSELQTLSAHCTNQEDAATKVERHMEKSAAACLLSSSIGAVFKGIVTGASETGTWVRIFNPPTEGKVMQGYEKLQVGDQVSVKLISVDVPKGYINFVNQKSK